MSRRRFLFLVGGAGTAAVSGAAWSRSVLAIPLRGGAGALDPVGVPKYVTSLPRPGVMPKTAVTPEGIDVYEIALRQSTQQLLPAGLPSTTVWTYGSLADPASFAFPGRTIEAKAGVPVRVKWSNGLVDGAGRFLEHLLPVDPSLHWSNPAGPPDSRPVFTARPERYRGPVPMVVHLHGAHTTEESDGYPEAWMLPNAVDIPAGYFRTGTRFDQFDRSNTTPGSAVYQYANDQRSTMLWYHDHTLGLTRLNVYAGAAGLWMIRGGASDAAPGMLPSGPYEVPVVIQDRSFNANGSLFYPDTRSFFDDDRIAPYIPDGPLPPIWQPEFFGNTMLVNGATWPVVDLEPRRYLLRILNGCNGRHLILKVIGSDPSTLRSVESAAAALPLHVVGSDGGLLPAPATVDALPVIPSERFDVVLDLTGIAPGTELYLTNEGPDSPFGGGTPGVDFEICDETTTRHVMKIRVGALASADTSPPIGAVTLPALARLPTPDAPARRLSLNENGWVGVANDGSPLETPISATLGTIDANGMPMPMEWMHAVSERPVAGSTEIWELCNFTMDAHPMHVHLVSFEVVERQAMAAQNPASGTMVCQLAGPVRAPDPWETGRKDVVTVLPGEVTRVKATFDTPGRYVWHCHVVEHEDNEMMRPFDVALVPSAPLGKAAQFALLGLGGRDLVLRDSTIVGSVGAGPGMGVTVERSAVSRALVLDPRSATNRIAAPAPRGGTMRYALDRPIADANATAAWASALASTQTIASISAVRTVVGTNGLNVISVGRIQLQGAAAVLTLTGSATTELVVNVTGAVSISGGASIVLQGIKPSQVLWNMSGKQLSIGKGCTARGVFLNPQGTTQINGGIVNGSVLAGNDVQVTGGSTITHF